ADAPPSAFHPSTSPRRYACANGIDFDMRRSATSGKLPLHSRFTKTGSGTHGSFDAHPPGMMCGGSACCAAVVALVLELGLALVPEVFVVDPGSLAGFSLEPQATSTTNAAVSLLMAADWSSERS